MRIRAKANGNIIHADDEAAKQLIEAGIYEEVSDKEPLSAESSQVPPGTSAISAPKAAAPTEPTRKTRRPRKSK